MGNIFGIHVHVMKADSILVANFVDTTRQSGSYFANGLFAHRVEGEDHSCANLKSIEIGNCSVALDEHTRLVNGNVLRTSIVVGDCHGNSPRLALEETGQIAVKLHVVVKYAFAN